MNRASDELLMIFYPSSSKGRFTVEMCRRNEMIHFQQVAFQTGNLEKGNHDGFDVLCAPTLWNGWKHFTQDKAHVEEIRRFKDFNAESI